MKKLAAMLTSLCMLTAFSGVTAFAEGETAVVENNTVGTAVDLGSDNTSYTSALADSKDQDWYKFTLSENGCLNVVIEHADDLGYLDKFFTVNIYESDGKTLIYQMISQGQNDSLSTCNLGLSAGNYYIQVTPSDYYSDAEYKISTVFELSDTYETENNDTMENADLLPVNGQFKGTLKTSKDVDWYKLTAEKSGGLKLQFNHSDALRSYSKIYQIDIYKSDGKTLLYQMYSQGEQESVAIPELGLEAGDYYIQVKSADYFEDAEYTIITEFTESDAWETELNDTLDTADNIEFNKEYSGTIRTNKDTDWYKVSAETDGYISFNFKHENYENSNVCWKVALYDSEGKNVIVNYDFKGNEDTDFTGINIGIVKGDYYVSVAPASSMSSVVYSLKVNFTKSDTFESELNNSYTAADTIDVNTEYTGDLLTSNDQDWFTFTTEKDGFISMLFNHKAVENNSNCWDISLYESDGQTLIYNFKSSGNVIDTKSHDIGIAAGTYYVKIKGSTNWLSEEYNMTVKFTESDAFEKENNNTNKTASIIDTNKVYTLNSMTSDDVDWLKFTTKESGYINFTFEHETIEKNGECWNVEIYTGDATTKIHKFGINGNSAITKSPTIGLPAGDYFVKFTSSSYQPYMNIDMNISFTPSAAWETEINDLKSNALQISIDERFGGSIMNTNDTDWFTFDISKAGNYKVTFENKLADDTTNKYWNVAIYESDGTTIVASEEVKGNMTTVPVEAALEPGTYFVKITGINSIFYEFNTSDYFITLSEANMKGDVDKDGEINSADALAILQMVVGILEKDIQSADIDGDGDVTSADALATLQFVVGITEKL